MRGDCKASTDDERTSRSSDTLWSEDPHLVAKGTYRYAECDRVCHGKLFRARDRIKDEGIK